MIIFLAIAATYSWPIHQLDINNVYLYGHIYEDVYMIPPPGYTNAKGEVYKLFKRLHGLKQEGRQWNKELTSTLQAYGFNQSNFNHCLFTRGENSTFLALIIYVMTSWLLVLVKNPISHVKKFMDNKFTIKYMGYEVFFRN